MRRLIPLSIVVALAASACASSGTTDIAAPQGPAASTEPVSASPEPTSSTASTKPEPASTEPAAENAVDWPYQFTATTVGGDSLDTGDYAGQDIVLWFWAPW